MYVQPSFKAFSLTAFLLLAIMSILAACGGDSTATLNTATTTGTTTPRGTARARPVTGTISQYNASSKLVTVSLSGGSTQTFSVAHARIVLNQKGTQQQFSALLAKSGIVVFAIGQKNSDGTYTAQTVVASTTMNGITATPGRQGTPRAGNGKTARVFVQHAVLKNNQLVGDDTNGQPVTVTLVSTTALVGQTEGTANDLRPGQTISIVAGTTQTNGAIAAQQISIGQIGGNGSAAQQ